MPQLLFVEVIFPGPPHTGRYFPKQCIDEFFQLRPDLVFGEIGAYQAHTAIDVVSDTARRNYASFVGIRGTHAANTKAVAPVDVGHGQARHLDTWQKCDVGHLFRCLVIADLLNQPVIREDDSIYPHAGFIALGNPPAGFVNSFQWTSIGLRHESFLLVRLCCRCQLLLPCASK
jgi:hypothetical protein